MRNIFGLVLVIPTVVSTACSPSESTTKNSHTPPSDITEVMDRHLEGFELTVTSISGKPQSEPLFVEMQVDNQVCKLAIAHDRNIPVIVGVASYIHASDLTQEPKKLRANAQAIRTAIANCMLKGPHNETTMAGNFTLTVQFDAQNMLPETRGQPIVFDLGRIYRESGEGLCSDPVVAPRALTAKLGKDNEVHVEYSVAAIFKQKPCGLTP